MKRIFRLLIGASLAGLAIAFYFVPSSPQNADHGRGRLPTRYGDPVGND